MISIDQLFKDVTITLDDYAHGVEGAMIKASEHAGMYAEGMLKNISPSRTGEYRKGWVFEYHDVKRGKRYRSELVVWNAKKYRLTHLLEKSHRIANKYGSYGKSTPQPHIAPTEKETEQEWARQFKYELGRIRI